MSYVLVPHMQHYAHALTPPLPVATSTAPYPLPPTLASGVLQEVHALRLRSEVQQSCAWPPQGQLYDVQTFKEQPVSRVQGLCQQAAPQCVAVKVEP